MDGIRDYTPNREIVVFINTNWLKFRIMRYEPCALPSFIQFELFKGVFAVNIGNDKIPVLGVKATINHHYITIKNTCVTHGITFHVRIKRRFRMWCHLTRKVNALTRMVGSR